jgi:hypothetical protein
MKKSPWKQPWEKNNNKKKQARPVTNKKEEDKEKDKGKVTKTKTKKKKERRTNEWMKERKSLSQEETTKEKARTKGRKNG